MSSAARSGFEDLLERVGFPLCPGETFGEIIRRAHDEKFDTVMLAKVIEANPFYAQALRKIDVLARRISDWDTEDPEHGLPDSVVAMRSVGLLGKGATRNLIACLRLIRLFKVDAPKKIEEPYRVQPRDQIKFALQAEDFCESRNIIDAHLAYCVGLHFDWLGASFKASKAPADLTKGLNEFFMEGLKIGTAAFKIGTLLKSMKYGRHAFACGLSFGLGKALMNMLYPKEMKEDSWANFAAEAKKQPQSAWMKLYFEEPKLFQFNHSDAASFALSFGEFLQEVEKSVLFWRNPFALHETSPDLEELAYVLSLAVPAALIAQGCTQPTEKILMKHQRVWMNKHKIDIKAFEKVAHELKAQN